jgi:hypothetical protein
MFSFHGKGAIKAVAEVKGGDLSGKFLYLHKKIDPIPERDGFFDEITLADGMFTYFPDTRDNFSDVITMSASRGSGKSTYAAILASKIKKVFKLADDDVIVVKKSKIEDPAFEYKINEIELAKGSSPEKVIDYTTPGLCPAYIYVDDTFLESPPTIDDIAHDGRPKVVILDDLDTIQGAPKLKKEYIKFQNSLIEEGRKYSVYVIVCNHRLCAGSDTKALLTESTYITFFPSGLTADFKYCLQRYCDMSPSLILELKKSKSQWVMYSQHNPKFVLTQYRAFVFDLEREELRALDAKASNKYLKKITYEEKMRRIVEASRAPSTSTERTFNRHRSPKSPKSESEDDE